MKKGDIVYIPQNTRCLGAASFAGTVTRTPLRGIWLASADAETSKIFLDGEVVYIKSNDIHEWRENVRSGESDDGFKPRFFSEKGLSKQ